MLIAEHASFQMIYNKTYSIRVFTIYMYLMPKSPMSKHKFGYVMTWHTVIKKNTGINFYTPRLYHHLMHGDSGGPEASELGYIIITMACTVTMVDPRLVIWAISSSTWHAR